MLISVEKKFVFVANSKTASTSIEAKLASHADIMRGGGPQRKHVFLRDIFQYYDFLFRQPDHHPDTYFKFGVMRDPLDWIQSWYRYRRGNQTAAPLPGDISFADFWALQDWNLYRQGGVKRLQKDFFLGKDGALLADYIIPYHDLERHFHEICRALKVPGQLKAKNVSRVRKIEEDLPASLIQEVRAFYAEDYALFDRIDEINSGGIEALRNGPVRRVWSPRG